MAEVKIELDEYVNKGLHGATLSIGRYLKDLRQQKKLSIRDLSERSKVSTAVISDLENLRSLPRTEVLLKLAYGLDIRVEDLFCHMYSDIPEKAFNISNKKSKSISLEDIITQQGLNSIETKDVLKYIEFLKFKSKH